MELHTKLVVPCESAPEEDSFERYHHNISFKATNIRTTPLKCLESGSERFNKFRIKSEIKRLQGQGRRGRAMVSIFITCQLTKLSELYLNCSGTQTKYRRAEREDWYAKLTNESRSRVRSVKLEKWWLYFFSFNQFSRKLRF